MSEKHRQAAKEKAILFALQQGTALLRDDLVMYGMHKNGSKTQICVGSSYDTLWQETLEALSQKYL